jgi:hypothetical protein
MLLEQLSIWAAVNLSVATYTVPATCTDFEREITKNFKAMRNVLSFPSMPIQCSLNTLEMLQFQIFAFLEISARNRNETWNTRQNVIICVDIDSALGSSYHMTVGSFAKFHRYIFSHLYGQAQKWKEYSCKMSETLSTSTWCNDPESTFTVKYCESLKPVAACDLAEFNVMLPINSLHVCSVFNSHHIQISMSQTWH